MACHLQIGPAESEPVALFDLWGAEDKRHAQLETDKCTFDHPAVLAFLDTSSSKHGRVSFS